MNDLPAGHLTVDKLVADQLNVREAKF